MKRVTIYHSADFDGLFSKAVAERYTQCDTVGWDHGNPTIGINELEEYDEIIIVDLPPTCVENFETLLPKIVWVDHHKSAIDAYGHLPFKFKYLIDGVAACRLLFQYFHRKGEQLPHREDFVNREVDETLAIRLAGEYDIWDRRDPRAAIFQLGLKSYEIGDSIMYDMVDIHRPDYAESIVLMILDSGNAVQKYKTTIDKKAMEFSHFVYFEGVKFLALNSAEGNSSTFASKDVAETGHDALMLYRYNGDVWTVSMYHAAHNTGLDLSVIAVNYGGGGHRGACGFRTSKPEWIK